MEITIHSSRLKRDVRKMGLQGAQEEYTRFVKTFLNGETRLQVRQVSLVLTGDMPKAIKWKIVVWGAPGDSELCELIEARFKQHLRDPRVEDGSDVCIEFVGG